MLATVAESVSRGTEMRRVYSVPVYALLLSAGCGVKPKEQLSPDPDELLVYSIDGPAWLKNDEQPFTPERWKGDILLGYPVLGKVDVADPGQRREISTAIKEGARYPGPGDACFIPRHAVRSVKDGQVIWLVICFECKRYRLYRGDDPHAWEGRISPGCQTLLDKLLTAAGVPLAPKGLD